MRRRRFTAVPDTQPLARVDLPLCMSGPSKVAKVARVAVKAASPVTIAESQATRLRNAAHRAAKVVKEEKGEVAAKALAVKATGLTRMAAKEVAPARRRKVFAVVAVRKDIVQQNVVLPHQPREQERKEALMASRLTRRTRRAWEAGAMRRLRQQLRAPVNLGAALLER